MSNTRANFLLLLTAAIWGFAFVAQRVGMEHVGPFVFNAARFALGAMFLVPFLLFSLKRSRRAAPGSKAPGRTAFWGILTGAVLFLGASLQQTGLVYTTAGKAGFITGLYVIIVPIMAHFIGKHSGIKTWAGAILAVIGLYLLTMTGTFAMGRGDLLVLGSAFFWALHVLLIGWLTKRIDSVRLAAVQYTTCSLLSLFAATIFEDIQINGVLAAGVPILYAGLFSVGIAYTLQVVAQRRARSTHAAIILSLEAVFAVIGGVVLLRETLSPRALVGCLFMLAGMVVSQFDDKDPL